MKNFFRLFPQAGIFAFLVFLSSNVSAQTTPTISYQGELLNNGAPASGMTTIKVLIYQSATGGTPLYTETDTVNVVNGIFNVAIGSITPLLPTLDFRKQYYLAISINSSAELSPRSLVSFAPYAFRALIADGVSGGAVGSLNGESGSVTLTGTNGITISNNAPNIIIGSTGVQSLNTAGGKLTLVGAGGTTITDTGSVLTIRSTTFTGGTGIQAVQNSDGAIALTNAGGPIATLGLAQQNATTGQILTWKGTAWRPASAPFSAVQNADSTITITNPNGPIDTIGLARQNASTGQVLVWNGSAWRPQTVSGLGNDSIKNLGDARVYLSRSSLYLGAGAGTHDQQVGNQFGGLNTAVGIQAMDSTTDGGGNAAIGFQALFNNTTGGGNTAAGDAALFSNKTGHDNTASGSGALYDNTTGFSNCGFGWSAGQSTASGSGNTAIGAGALRNDSGSNNVAIGYDAMDESGGGFSRGVSHIVAIGDSSLMQDAYEYNSGSDSTIENTAIGSGSLRWTNSGAYNTGTGFQALHQNVSGYRNTANGVQVLWNNLGSNNTAVGSNAMFTNTSGWSNVAMGINSLYKNTTGSTNTAIGDSALYANTSGVSNTALGFLALSQNTIGNNNVAVGDNSGPASSGLTNTISIGSGAQATVNGQVMLGNPGVTSLYCAGAYFATTANAANLYVASNGQIMRSTSSARYKTDIHDLDINTERLYDLRPVSYISKIDGKPYFGLVAEDVARVLPELAEYARSKDVIPGSTSDVMIPDAVKYPMLSVLLLDELKKEHAKIASQEKIIADMERRLEAVEASQKAAH